MKRLIPILWIVLVLGMGAAGYFLLWELPRDAAARVGDVEKQVELENSYRATGAQIFLGLGLFLGIILTYRRIRAIERQAQSAERQARTAEQGQITERFTRAIEQLGKQGEEHTAIRLGGIYALERILRDSKDDAPTVQEVLAAFVRDESVTRWKHATRGSETSEANSSSNQGGTSQEPFRLSAHTDLQAALTVLGRNPIPNRRIDLSRARLESAYLREAHLKGADLTYAHLEGANLVNARLEWADLRETHLERAKLTGADLTNALMVGAFLERTILIGSDLTGAGVDVDNLKNAIFTQEDFEDAFEAGAFRQE